MKKIIPIIFATVVALWLGVAVKNLWEVKQAGDYLRAKTEWCYERNGVMIEVNCYTKSLFYMEMQDRVLFNK